MGKITKTIPLIGTVMINLLLERAYYFEISGKHDMNRITQVIIYHIIDQELFSP